jgi:hypothetical protein
MRWVYHTWLRNTLYVSFYFQGCKNQNHADVVFITQQTVTVGGLSDRPASRMK